MTTQENDMATTDEIQALRDELHQLRTEVAALRNSSGNSSEPSSGGEASGELVPATAVGRRAWMKAAAGAAVGGTALALSNSQPVAANDPNDITLGATKTNAAGLTQANYTGSSAGSAFLFQSGTTYTTGVSFVPAALAGWTTRTEQPSGIDGFTAVDSQSAYGVIGRATGSQGAGVRGSGSSYGVEASGVRSALRLTPVTETMPKFRTDAHIAGEIDVVGTAVGAETWLCVFSGTPGAWRKIGGLTTAGSLHAFEPFRAYDSRNPAPTPGVLAIGDNRVVSVKDSRNLDTGAVFVTDRIPEGATAISYNVTVTGTVNRGFLAVAPGSATTFSASTVNWSSSGQDIANASIVALDNSRQIKVFCGGPAGGSAHFIIDITGYYL